MNKKILIVEDEQKVSELLCDYLGKEQYITKVQDNGEMVIKDIKENSFDLILLDVGLPGKDGLTLCKEIRQFSRVPIIMITARVEEIDRIMGLELGADDYVCKPFSFREVVARVRAMFRRIDEKEPKNTTIIGKISVSTDMRQVLVGSEELKLTPSEFEILNVMINKPDRVFSRNELIEKTQGYNFEGYDRTIDTHVKNLRKKIGEKLPGCKVISTVFGVGYKFSTGDL